MPGLCFPGMSNNILNMKIYLAGKIPKGDEIGKSPDWRADYGKALHEIGDAKILSPEDDPLDESQSLLVFGHD